MKELITKLLSLFTPINPEIAPVKGIQSWDGQPKRRKR